MDLKLIKTDWGMQEYGDMRSRLAKYAKAGYQGIECEDFGMEPEAFGEAAGELGLDCVAMVICDDERAFEAQFAQALRADPILINCHPGRDFMSFERGCEFFTNVIEIANDTAVPVTFETHRGRILYSPWVTARYLEAFPEMWLTADFSHFTNVAENNLEGAGYRELLELAIQRSRHIHARVGHMEGPQVPDPRQGIGREWTERFEAWWDRIIENAIHHDLPFVTVNAEFGPPDYQPVDPATGEALADIWEVCLYISKRFQKRYANHPFVSVAGTLVEVPEKVFDS